MDPAAVDTIDDEPRFWEHVPGERLDTRAAAQGDPASVHTWLAARPAVATRLLAALLELHVGIVAAGWIAGDLYDGCLLFDRESARLSVIDLDGYHRGSTINAMGRMFGSSRWMAPEEFEPGAAIDERTTVFTLGRAIAWILGNGSDDRRAFRGNDRQWDAVQEATAADPGARIQTVAALAATFSGDGT